MLRAERVMMRRAFLAGHSCPRVFRVWCPARICARRSPTSAGTARRQASITWRPACSPPTGRFSRACTTPAPRSARGPGPPLTRPPGSGDSVVRGRHEQRAGPHSRRCPGRGCEAPETSLTACVVAELASTRGVRKSPDRWSMGAGGPPEEVASHDGADQPEHAQIR